LFHRAKVICQNQNDLSNEIRNIRHDLMLSILKNSLTLHWSHPQEIVPLQTKHTRALLSSRMSRVWPRNSDASETSSNSEQSSKLNIHYEIHWRKLDPLEMHSKRRSVCIVSHANVADVTSAKRADP
jgi:uncharacterized protein YcfL